MSPPCLIVCSSDSLKSSSKVIDCINKPLSWFHFVSVASDNFVFILNVSDFYCVIFNELNRPYHCFFLALCFEFDKPKHGPLNTNLPFFTFGFHKSLLQLVGFFIPTPQAWHLMYGGTAPHTAHRAKKYPSKTYAPARHSPWARFGHFSGFASKRAKIAHSK